MSEACLRELRIRTVHGKDGKDTISIDLPAMNHQLERIVINGKELDIVGLCTVRIDISTATPCPVMTLETIPEYYRS